MISTAKAIKKTREAQGMTQKELAERCGYTVTDIKAYELGEKEPKHINLMTIAGALGVTMYEVFERMTEIPKERIQELLNFKKEYEDEPETEKCLEELLVYKETMAGIARMLGVTKYDITNKNEELLEVNLNNDVIKNALDRYRSFENTFLNKVTVMALKELLEYRETKLAPDQVNEMKSKFEHYKDAYCDIQERYNSLLNYEMEE